MSAAADTIAAIATPPGRGGIGIVRVSGPAAAEVAEHLAGGLPRPRRAAFRTFRGAAGEALDHGLVLFFPAPHSFTGEDVIELHGHGGPVVMDMLLERVLTCGVRLAQPGEFSQRAYLNGKLDLAQAEAVADLIEAGTREAAGGALRSLRGEFSRRVAELRTALIGLQAELEASIDFPDEGGEVALASPVAPRLGAVQAALEALRAQARRGSLLREGLTVVLLGQPNVGKSSLLNVLAGNDLAIVTAEPGTTRDVVREHIALAGLPVQILDTAGLRDSASAVEREGIHRAWRAAETADHVLLVVDDRAGPGESERETLQRCPAGAACTVVRNKIDLSGGAPGLRPSGATPEIGVSALSGAGLDALRAHLSASAGRDAEAGVFLARRRHLDALERTAAALAAARAALEGETGEELIAEELRHAQRALGEISGKFTSEDLLGEIFASFCIGK